MLTNIIPLKLYSSAQVRRFDEKAIGGGIPGIQLMKRAGRALFQVSLQQWPSTQAFLVFCGAGNNGGDGYVVAALAAQKRLAVKVIAVSDPKRLKGDAKLAYQYALQENVEIVSADSIALDSLVAENQIIVDAVLGTGFSGELASGVKSVIEWISAASSPVISADLPSGLHGDTGAASVAVCADVTVTFVACKRGLLTGRGPALSGAIYTDDLDIPATVFDGEPCTYRVDSVGALTNLFPRAIDAHKGLFGHVLVVGGGAGFGGAALMAAEAALHAGAGLVSVATRPEHVAPILARIPEVMVCGVTSGQELAPLLNRPSVIVIGPGLGQTPWAEQMLQQVLAKTQESGIPLVLDADALNLLAKGKIGVGQTGNNWVITPHPGEAARLLGTSIESIQANRFDAAVKLQALCGGACILKGPGSLIASAGRTALARVGNPGMAAGGMGDVLAGLVGALLAQGLSASNAAELGVCVHGDAADLGAAETGMRGLRATQLIPYIRELLNPEY